MSQKVAVSVVFVLAMFMSIMDVTIVNVALPQLGQDLGAARTAVSEVAIGYLVSLAVVIPASGWLGDRFGTKRILLIAIVIFTVASALCGVAQTFSQLVAFRVLQGIGGGMLTPVGMAMLFRVFPPEERVRASSILTTPTALAPAIGPVLGGVLVTALSWRWVFFVNLPIGIVALVFGILFVHEEDANAVRQAFDLRGFVLSGLGLGAFMYGVSEGPERGWHTPLVLAAVAVGVVLLGILVRQQLHATAPLLRLNLFRDRLFRSATAVLFVASAGFLGVLYLVALFFQDGLGLSALGSGLSTFPEALGVMVGAQVTSRLLYARIGPRRLMVGGLLGVATAMALLSLVNSTADLWPTRVVMFFLGYSISHMFVSAQAAAFARISSADTGRASTLFNALRQLGGAFGVALLTTAVTLSGDGGGAATTGTTGLHPFHVGFLVAAGLALLAAVIALSVHDGDAVATRVRRMPPRDPDAALPEPTTAGYSPGPDLTCTGDRRAALRW